MMQGSWRHAVLLLVLAGIVLGVNLGAATLFDEDEPRNAACAREMLERRDWLVPTFNYELRTDKPVLLYWGIMLAYLWLGVGEAAARLPSVLASLLTVLSTLYLGRVLFGRRVGFWAGLILCTSLLFDVSARAATPDALLVACVTVAMTIVAGCIDWEQLAVAANDPLQHDELAPDLTWVIHRPGLPAIPPGTAIPPLPRLGWLAAYFCLGLAVLAKGPAGLVLPVGVWFAFWLAVGLHRGPVSRPLSAGEADASPTASPTEPDWLPLSIGSGSFAAWLRAVMMSGVRSARSLWGRLTDRKLLQGTLSALFLPTGLTVVLLVAGPWYVLVTQQTDGAWLAGFFGRHNVARFLQPLEGHSGPIWFYGPALFVGMLPWSVLLVPAALDIIHTYRRAPDKGIDRRTLFLLCWVGVYLTVFSCAQTKLPSYVLPCYPAMAVLFARHLIGWQGNPGLAVDALMRGSFAVVMLVGAVVATGLPVLSQTLLPGEDALSLAGLIPLLGGAWAWYRAERGERRQASKVLAVTAWSFSLTLFAIASPRVSQHQASKPFVERARERSAEAARVGMFEHHLSSLVYYSQDRVDELLTPEQVRAYFWKSPHVYVVTRSDQLAALAPLPEGVVVLERRRRFLKTKHDSVLLGWTGPAAYAAAERPGGARRE